MVLLGLARLIIGAARRMPRSTSAIWRYAIGNIHRPGSAAASVILALGLGLTLFVTLALTDRSISSELRSGIPERAPAFFFLDVRNTELAAVPGGGDEGSLASPHVNNSPMLRGRVVAVKGVPAEKVSASPESNWALRGDRGLTYAETLPEGSKLVEGEWWPADYDGPPLVSLVDEIANGIGVKIGDEITVNVLGREITAKVANLRQVNWRSFGINFVMVFTPNTLKGAPHSHIVTVEMNGGDEAQLLNRMARAYPSVTAVRVKDAIDIVSDAAGADAGGDPRGQCADAVHRRARAGGRPCGGLVRTALRGRGAQDLWRLEAAARGGLRHRICGTGACGGGLRACGWLRGVMVPGRFILEMPWSFSAVTAILTALIAMVVTITAGLAVTWTALSAKPAPFLRNE